MTTDVTAPRLRSLAAEGGFSDATVADMEHPFWRFYRLVP